MGGAYGLGPNEDEDIVGIIPRVIRDLFDGIRDKEDQHVFNVKVSYLEVCYRYVHLLLRRNDNLGLRRFCFLLDVTRDTFSFLDFV